MWFNYSIFNNSYRDLTGNENNHIHVFIYVLPINQIPSAFGFFLYYSDRLKIHQCVASNHVFHLFLKHDPNQIWIILYKFKRFSSLCLGISHSHLLGTCFPQYTFCISKWWKGTPCELFPQVEIVYQLFCAFVAMYDTIVFRELMGPIFGTVPGSVLERVFISE